MSEQGSAHYNTALILSPEEAEHLNATYDFALYLGAHKDEAAPNVSFYLRVNKTDYEQIDQMVGSLQPGDALFVENLGYTKGEERLTAELIEERLRDREDAAEVRTKLRGTLDELRQTYQINAWDYAIHLAALEGVHTEYVDLDEIAREAVVPAGDISTLRALKRSPNPTDRENIAKMDQLREEAAFATVLDWARTSPAATNPPLQGARKTRAVMLYGRGHKNGLEELFATSGLQCTTNMLIDASLGQAADEHLGVDRKDDTAKYYSQDT